MSGPYSRRLRAPNSSGLDEVSGFKEEALPAYSDQILPFDITLAGTNLLDAAPTMNILVEILKVLASASTMQ